MIERTRLSRPFEGTCILVGTGKRIGVRATGVEDQRNDFARGFLFVDLSGEINLSMYADEGSLYREIRFYGVVIEVNDTAFGDSQP